MAEAEEAEPGKPTPGTKVGTLSVAALATTIGGAFTGFAALPKEFEQYPIGGAVVAFMLVCGLISWILVTWLKHRRK